MAHEFQKDPELLQTHLDSGCLGQLVTKAKQLQAMNRILQELLPPTLKPYCQVMNARESILIIQVKSAVWITRLRMDCPDLLNRLQFYKPFEFIRSLEYRINPEAFT